MLNAEIHIDRSKPHQNRPVRVGVIMPQTNVRLISALFADGFKVQTTTETIAEIFSNKKYRALL